MPPVAWRTAAAAQCGLARRGTLPAAQSHPKYSTAQSHPSVLRYAKPALHRRAPCRGSHFAVKRSAGCGQGLTRAGTSAACLFCQRSPCGGDLTARRARGRGQRPAGKQIGSPLHQRARSKEQCSRERMQARLDAGGKGVRLVCSVSDIHAAQLSGRMAMPKRDALACRRAVAAKMRGGEAQRAAPRT